MPSQREHRRCLRGGPREAHIEDDLALFDAAKRALAEAHQLDEAGAIPNREERLRTYRRQADGVLVEAATEINLRMERRLGQMLMEPQPT